MRRAVLAALLAGLPACRGQASSGSHGDARNQAAEVIATTSRGDGGSAADARTARAAPSRSPAWDESKPKAPSRTAMGVEVGKTTLAEARAFATRAGMACQDASPSLVGEKMREARAAEMAARGVPADVIASASWNQPSPHEGSQVRWLCANTPTSALHDHARPANQGELLFVFDSAQHALRHVSFSRQRATTPVALADLRDTIAAYDERFGPPTVVKYDLPDKVAADFTLPPATSIAREWHFGDLRVRVAAFTLDGKDVRVSEAVEVPAGVAMKPVEPAPAQGGGAATKSGAAGPPASGRSGVPSLQSVRAVAPAKAPPPPVVK